MFDLASHARGIYCSLQNRLNYAVWLGPTASTTMDSMTVVHNYRLLAVHRLISWCGLDIRRRKAPWIIRSITGSHVITQKLGHVCFDLKNLVQLFPFIPARATLVQQVSNPMS